MTSALPTKLGDPWNPAVSRRDSFPTLIKIAVVLTLIWFLYWDVLLDMAHDWWNVPAWSQGMLLPPLAIYIAWVRRSQTLAHRAISDTRGLMLTAFGCLMFVSGRLATEFFLSRMSFVVVLAGLTWTFWGRARLATMVPLPVMFYNSLAAPLQLFASDLATRCAQAFGISVFRDGNIIELAGTSLGVAEACSGLNSLSALIVGSLLLGYLMCTRMRSRLALFFLAIPLAIVVNVVRVTGTAVLADYNSEYALGFYHSFSGWLVFVAGFSVLYVLARIAHAVLDVKESNA
jgi:exosortase